MGRPFLVFPYEEDNDKNKSEIEDDMHIPFNTSLLNEQFSALNVMDRRRRARIIPFFDAQSTFRTRASVLEYISRVRQNASFALLFNLEFAGLDLNEDIQVTLRLLKNINPEVEDVFLLELLDYWEEHYDELYDLFVLSRRTS
jgi:hypothetical protein